MVEQIYSEKLFKLFGPIINSYLKDKWNTKWKKSYVSFNPRGEGYVDVRDIFNKDTVEENKEMQDYVDSFKLKGMNDDKIVEIFKKVRYDLNYVGDFKVWKQSEYWQNAYQTFKLNTGDCEDGAILLYKYCILAGIPAWRLKVCAGWVRDPNDPEKLTGHAYLIYCSELFNDWFVLDWCYYGTTSLNAYRAVPHRDLLNYKDIWWTTNHLYSWAQKDTDISEGFR